VHIPARVDYGMRALLQLAASDKPLTADELADAQGLPVRFLRAILSDLRRAGILISQRGVSGGFHLAKSASEVTVAQVIRTLDGPLAEVRGARPHDVTYEGPAVYLRTVWVATRAALRQVLENTSLADVVAGAFTPEVRALIDDPDAWKSH
jgi:Rrf2 family protein